MYLLHADLCLVYLWLNFFLHTLVCASMNMSTTATCNRRIFIFIFVYNLFACTNHWRNSLQILYLFFMKAEQQLYSFNQYTQINTIFIIKTCTKHYIMQLILLNYNSFLNDVLLIGDKYYRKQMYNYT